MKVPGRIQKMELHGKEVLVVEQQFEINREGWNEYKLLDGGIIRLKTSVHRIYRVVDEDGMQQFDDQGQPVSVVRHRFEGVITTVAIDRPHLTAEQLSGFGKSLGQCRRRNL